MADQIVGKAVYQTEVDPSGTTQGLAAADAQVSKSAAATEQSYSKAASAGTNVGKAVQVGAGIAAAGFGLMTQAAGQAQTAQGAFIAATGKSRAEAQQFTQDMNALRGTSATVGKSFEDIAAAGTQVAQQLGLTGKAGADATNQFLAFSRVTGQNAAAAVDGLSGALDAFNEPAERAGGLMDQLIASNQRYGTDIGPSAVQALSNMAPALQAMGKGLDYGVGLLNLFETANIDASVGQKALNKALSELPPGTNFDQIIAKLGALQDPLARRTEAAKIFGDALGTKLADAIQPGMTSLDDFQIKTEDVQGTTEDTAASMDTAGDKAQQWADKAKAAFDGIAQSVGPLVSGMGAIVSSVGALSPGLTSKIAGLWDDVANSGPVHSAVDTAGKAVTPIYTKGVDLVDGVKGKILDAWSAAKDVARDAISSAGIAAKGAYQNALDLAQGVKFKLQDAWVAAKDVAREAVGVAARAATAAYQAALRIAEGVATAVNAAWSGLTTVAAKVAADLAGKAYAAAAFVVDRLSDAANVAWGFLEGAAEGAAKKAGGVLGKLFGGSFSDNVVSTITGATGTIIGNLSGDLIKNVTTKWDDVVRPWLSSGLTGKLITGLQGAWQKVASSSVVSGAVGAAAAAGNAVYVAAASATEKLLSVLSAAWQSLKTRLAPAALEAGAANGAEYAAGASATQGLSSKLSGAWSSVASKGSSLLSAVGGVGAIVGTAFGVGAVVAIGAYVLEHRDEIAGFFKPVGDAVDKIMALGGDTSMTEQQARSKIKGVATGMAKELGIAADQMRGILQDAFQEGIEHGLSPADAYTYAVAAGKDIGATTGTSTAQSFEDKLKAAGLQVPTEVSKAAGTEAGETAGESAADAFVRKWQAGEIYGPLSPAQLALLQQTGVDAGNTIASGTLQGFINAGIPADIAAYLVANATIVDAAGKQMVDPAKQDLVKWAQDVGALVGGGVPESLAKNLAAGSGQVSDGVAAMLQGITLNSSQAAVAQLYQQLNVPQQLAVKWASEGPFELSKAVQQVFTDTAHQIPPTLAMQIVNAGVAAGLVDPQTARYWGQSLYKVGVETGEQLPQGVVDGTMSKADYLKRLGTDMDGLLSDAMTAPSATSSLKDATSKLSQIIRDGLDPDKQGKKDALFAIGKKYMTEVQKGLESEDQDTVDATRSVAIHGINAIEDAGLKGAKGQRGLDRIGQLYMQMLQSGMIKEDARTALVADSVASDTVDKLESWYPEFTTTGEGFSKHVATGISNESDKPKTAASTDIGGKLKNLPFGDWGEGQGSEYATGVASGINTFNWSNKLSHMAQVFMGTSPPKRGPIREMVLSATHVGEAYGDLLIDGLTDRISQRQASLAQLAVVMQPALQRALGYTPASVASPSATLTVNHLLTLDLKNAPAGITPEQVAGMVQVPVDWDAKWQQKMEEAQASSGIGWVGPPEQW